MKTDNEIIDKLGGTTAVAQLCRVTVGAVSQWRTAGIPRARRQLLEVLYPDLFQTEDHRRSVG